MLIVRVALVIMLVAAVGACANGYDLGNLAPGYRDAQNQKAQTDLTNAQTEALRQWNQCMQTGRDANQCGPAPTVSTPAPQQSIRTDAVCMSDCFERGYAQALCKQRCSY